MVQDMGEGFVLGLVTALRLGLSLTYLPVLGPKAIAARIAAAKPVFVITDRQSAFAAPKDLQHLLVEDLPQTPDDEGVGSHTYREAEVAFRLFSPLRRQATEMVPLTAGRAHRRSLCDAIVLHRIASGDRIAAPGLDAMQHQPATIMAALIRGATFVHVPPGALEATPALLWEKPLASLGVGVTLRDLCLHARVQRPQIRSWYRDPTHFSDWRAWRSFVSDLQIGDIPVTNAVVEAATGGALMTSARRPGGIGQLVLPAAGRPWALADLVSGQQAAIPGFGLFKPTGEAFRSLTPMVLVRHGEELFFGDRARPAKGGKRWPSEEVIAEAMAMPGVEGASAHVLFTGEAAGRYANALVVFTGANPVDSEALASSLRQRLRRGYGPDWVPDHITVAPILPRLSGAAVDHAWCEGQLLTGLLHQKARLETFRLLTALKSAVRPRTPAGRTT